MTKKDLRTARELLKLYAEHKYVHKQHKVVFNKLLKHINGLWKNG